MKLSECPEQYKIYIFKISNGDRFQLTGEQKINLFKNSSNMVELENGKGFNKAFIVSWHIDLEATKENVLKHTDEIKNSFNKSMITYPITIIKPFELDIPIEGVKKGDVGIYSKHIKDAIKGCYTLKISTPGGISYASPKQIKKDNRIIYRKFLKQEPMMLFLYTPKYNNKSDFETPEEIKTDNALVGMPEKYRAIWKAKLGIKSNTLDKHL